jgi:hypothetical protein|tara:strand:- start:928 stop:1143 length:216 start_codon:yes stop_codon:yes gene_type:complete
MTQDFIEDAIEACNREKIPFLFAMRAGGDQGDWRVTYNLEHRDEDPNPSRREEILALMEFLLSGEDESDRR